MKKKYYIFLTFLLLSNPNLYSQFQNIKISDYFFPHEIAITINPKNTNIIVAGANAYGFTPNDTSFSGYYYSTNGGYNWTSGFLFSSIAQPGGDPVILVDTSGYFYYIQNSNVMGSPYLAQILCMKSTNGGANWGFAAKIGYDTTTYQDKPGGCVDWSDSPFTNNIYTAWTRFDNYILGGPNDSSRIYFSRSTDRGITWGNAVRLSQKAGFINDSCNTVEGTALCTGLNGEVYVAWSGPKVYNSVYGIFLDKSTDGGVSWLDDDIYVTDQPGGWAFSIPNVLRCNGFPVICCDHSSSPYRGTLYINFADQRNGTTDTDIWLVKSTNGGINWSMPKRVNDDPPGKHQFFNWMTIDQSTGYLYFVFYDQRGLSIATANVYVARSTDGGETFQNSRVSQSPFPLIMYNGIWDYIGITAHNGKIRPAWTRSESNKTSIWTAIIDSFYVISIKKISENIPSEFVLHQNYPNPFNPSTTIRFDIPEYAYVKLSVYDITGSLKKVIIQDYLNAGEYSAGFNAGGLSGGIYFLVMESADFKTTRKMILIK